MIRGLLIFIFFICSALTYSQKETDELWNTWTESKDPSERINSIIDIIWEEYVYNQPDSAMYYADLALQLAIDNELKFLEADILNIKGSICWIKGENSQALEFLNKSVVISLKLDHKKGLGFSYNNIGMVFSELGENDSTIYYYNKSLKIKEKIGDMKAISSSYMNIGTYYYDIGNLPLSLSYYFKSLKIDEELGYEEDVAMVISNIGLIYFEQKDYDKAIDYFHESMDIDRKQGVSLGVVTSLFNIAHAYQYLNKLEKALICYEKALEISRELKIEKYIASSLNNIGSLYMEKGENEVALDYLNQGLEIRNKINDKIGLASSLNNIGDLYVRFGDINRAQQLNEKALILATENGNVEKLKTISQSLYKIYKSTGKYDRALNMHEDYLIYKDSLFNEENLRSSIQEEYSYRFTNDSIQKLKDDIEHEKEDAIMKFKYKEEISQFRLFAVIGAFFSLIMCLMAISLYRQNKLKQKANKQIQIQKDEVDLKNKEITESIVYAKRIQDAILTSKEYIDQALPESFLMYMPKDLVSGDFYWVYEEDDIVYFTVVDCTGHGVPGAFMSMIGYSLLNEIVIESGFKETDMILSQLSNQIKSSMEQKGSIEESRDGMDMVFCRWDKKSNELMYTGAKNSLHLIRDGKLIEYAGDQRPVGYETGRNVPFSKNIVKLQKGDSIYLFSDGYADQFGGERGKKFKSKKLKDLLININDRSLKEQHDILNKNFNEWKGDFEQVDDVCVMGVRV